MQRGVVMESWREGEEEEEDRPQARERERVERMRPGCHKGPVAQKQRTITDMFITF